MKRAADIMALVAVATGTNMQYVATKKTAGTSMGPVTAILSLDEHGQQKTWLPTG